MSVNVVSFLVQDEETDTVREEVNDHCYVVGTEVLVVSDCGVAYSIRGKKVGHA